MATSAQQPNKPKLCPEELCTGCTACVASCEHNCLTMAVNQEGFFVPVLSTLQCTGCGRCETVCPVLHPSSPRTPLDSYAVQHKDHELRISSSSGGAFSALSEIILSSGGIVYGAMFDQTFRVVHRSVHSLSALGLLRGSKYVQSDMRGVFREVRDHLRKGRLILFAGTPCQIAGLCSFLGQVPESLLCVDFVCHGVPSPRVFELWKASMENLYRSTTVDVSFRQKDDGWHRFSLMFTFANGQKYRGNVKEEPYLRGFLSNLFLRSCCHTCRFKALRGSSDVTIADYWGVKKTLPDWDDDRGTSLVLINTHKGTHLFSSCNNRIRYQAVGFADAVASNPAIIRQSQEHPKRTAFFGQLEHHPVDKLVPKYARIAWRRRIKWRLKQLTVRWSNRKRKL